MCLQNAKNDIVFLCTTFEEFLWASCEPILNHVIIWTIIRYYMCTVKSSVYKYINFRKKAGCDNDALLLISVLKITNNPKPSLFQL